MPLQVARPDGADPIAGLRNVLIGLGEIESARNGRENCRMNAG
jgi:hypothetical protein